jgi:hypothetical protein
MEIDAFNQITYLQRLDNHEGTNSFLLGLNGKKYAVIFKQGKYNILEDSDDLHQAVQEALSSNIWLTPLDAIKKLQLQSPLIIAKEILSRTVVIENTKKPIITRTQIVFFSVIAILSAGLLIKFYLNKADEEIQIPNELPILKSLQFCNASEICEKIECPPCKCPIIECPTTFKWLKSIVINGFNKILRKN